MKKTAFLASSIALLAGAADGSLADTPATTAAARSPTPSATARTWTFDTDAAGAAPAGFSFARTGSGAQGRWVVRPEAGAPSGAHVLAQLDQDDTSYRFPVAIADEPSLRDMRVTVRCMAVSGRVDQACGLVARYRDENNYIVARANALEDNVRLYTVHEGQRRQIATWSGIVTPNSWHELRLDVRGDHLEVYWDTRRVIDHHDTTFTEAGRVGIWTKADSITHFDDLRVEPL